MLTKNELDNSIRETFSLMEEGKLYYLSKYIWDQLNQNLKDNNYSTINNEYSIRKQLNNLDYLYKDKVFYTVSINNFDSIALAFAAALALALVLPWPAALALAISEALITGEITLHKDTNNLIKYKTIKEKKEEILERSYLEID